MSDRVVIRCPGCDRKLGLKQALLGKQIKCPGCGTVLRTKTSKSSQPDADKSRQRRRKTSEKRRPASDPEATASPRQKQSSPRSAANSNPSGKRRSSAQRKKKPAPAPIEDEFLDDFGGEYEEYDDAFSDDDAYDDDGYGESWLDDAGGEDWNSPTDLPSAPRKKKTKKRSAGSTKGKKKAKQRSGPGSIFVWVGAGLIAGLVSVALTIAMGFTGIGFLMYISSIIGSGLIGGAIRATAGTTDGWGPGLVAVAIAIPAMFLGRVGACFVDPELAGWFDEDTPEEVLQDISRQTTHDGMIANIIESELYSDQRWLNGVGLAEDGVYSEAWENDDFDGETMPYREQYVEVAWTEGERRWNSIPEDLREEQRETRRLELMLGAGVMDKESLDQLLARRASDSAMIERVSQDVAEDTAWIADSGVTKADLINHFQQNFAAATPEARVHPLVWGEATRRWSELSEEGRDTMRSTTEQELSDEVEIVAGFKEDADKIRVGAAIFFAIISLVMPFMPLGCTISSIGLAFSIGSGLESG